MHETQICSITEQKKKIDSFDEIKKMGVLCFSGTVNLRMNSSISTRSKKISKTLKFDFESLDD